MYGVIIPFDDSQQKDRRRATSNTSTNTSTFDAYRQGIELTSTKFYTSGLVKIHNGYNEQTGKHEVTHLILGQSKPILKDTFTFQEATKFVPESRFGTNSTPAPKSLDSKLSVSSDITSKDGVIEPLEIRDLVLLRKHTSKIDHKILGLLDEGNVSHRNTTDIFFDIIKFSKITNGNFPFLDEANVAGNSNGMSLSTESNSPDNRLIYAFDDSQQPGGIILNTTMENNLKTALLAMNPSSVNALPNEYVHPGATGFVF